MRAALSLAFSCLLAGCGISLPGGVSPSNKSLTEDRQGHQTRITSDLSMPDPVPQPPPELFQLVRFPSPAGELPAYLGVPQDPVAKSPAIIWLFGGFSNGIGETAWEESPPDNDQSASAFRRAGIVMMYPALRGGSDGVSRMEGFYGEVDDVLAAADFLRKQEFVDPARIYLGGHSTGGTLALLAAESSDQFRAVFSFGPVEDVSGYGQDVLPFDIRDSREVELRAPGRYLNSIKSPVFILEGTEQPGNIDSLRSMNRTSRKPEVPLQCVAVQGADHFSILQTVTAHIAGKIVHDTGPTCNITLSEQELNSLFGR